MKRGTAENAGMWMPSIKCSVAHILQGKPAPAHLAEEAGTSYMVKLKCGLVTDRVWVQGNVTKVRPEAKHFIVADMSEQPVSMKVRLPMAGAEWPAVGDYVRIIGRLGLPKGSDAGSVAGTPAATAQGGAGNSQDSSGAPRHATPTQGGPTPRPHSSKQQPFITAHKVNILSDGVERDKLWHMELRHLHDGLVYPMLAAAQVQERMRKRPKPTQTDTPHADQTTPQAAWPPCRPPATQQVPSTSQQRGSSQDLHHNYPHTHLQPQQQQVKQEPGADEPQHHEQEHQGQPQGSVLHRIEDCTGQRGSQANSQAQQGPSTAAQSQATTCTPPAADTDQHGFAMQPALGPSDWQGGVGMGVVSEVKSERGVSEDDHTPVAPGSGAAGEWVRDGDGDDAFPAVLLS